MPLERHQIPIIQNWMLHKALEQKAGTTEMESTVGCMTYSNSQLVLSELGRATKQDSDKDFLLDHTLVRNLNLVLGSSVHLFAKPSKHPEMSV